jgi:tRNA 2-thiouridine synthesizing protein C
MTDSATTGTPKQKRFMLVKRRAPHGTIYALEALEVVLIAATFDQDVSLAFLDDGVFALLKGQKAAALEMKNFSAMYRALEDYDVNKLYVERESLEQRGLSADDLLVAVEVIDSQEMGARMAQQDVVLSF